MEVPVYLVLGMLESGKTHFLRDALLNPNFTEDERTLIIACEEGEEEYDEEFLQKANAKVVYVEDVEELTTEFCRKCQREHKPDRVMIEYNGMWPLSHILNLKIPQKWMICQIITMVEAATFPTYYANMRLLMSEKFAMSQYLMMTRCTEETDLQAFDLAVHRSNPRAEIDFVFEDGHIEAAPPFLPFDLSAPVIEIADEDFGVWFMDAKDDPAKYDGKVVHFRASTYRSEKFPKGYMVPGRFGTNCCADEMQFLGFVCKTPDAHKYENDTWVWVTAEMKYEFSEAYNSKNIVLHAKKIEPAPELEGDSAIVMM